MRSAIVLSSPRAGTHLVMGGLHAVGMSESTPLTNLEWEESPESVLDIPKYGHYRFGAHVCTDRLLAAWVDSDVFGIYVQRTKKEQLRSYKAYVSFVRGRHLTIEQAEMELDKFIKMNSKWKSQPRVLTVDFENLIHCGSDWKRIMDHIGMRAFDIEAIKRIVPPKPGHKYYRNWLPSRLDEARTV